MRAITILSLSAITVFAGPLLNNGVSKPQSPSLIDIRDNGHGQCEQLPEDAMSPSLIVPISRSNADKKFGSTQWPIITPDDMCSIFKFDIPDSAKGKTCTLLFYLPRPDQTTKSYTMTGNCHFNFTAYQMGKEADVDTTYKTQPPRGDPLDDPPSVMLSGNVYTVMTWPCGGKSSINGVISSKDTSFNYFQSRADCPIGFFITAKDSK